ncbi:MAG: FAD-binding oxidoreductase [Betaproteobacteria bacterium]|nr:FAD-binding oxidoreductase [Betaproteobacteria bacterium]
MNRYPALLSALRTIVGEAYVLTEGDLTGYELDWRKRERGKALAVVRPASTEQVAAVVKACAAAGVSIVPQGGNTGMVVGSTPDASGTQVVLSLTRMNAVRTLDAANLTITVEAGCVLQTLQEVCEQAGFLFPLSLASEGSCTIGGNLGTNAGGTQVVRYGNTRELCLGLEVVTAQGEVWSGLTGLRKDNTGYDLRHLFIGSEGTLGVITAATMKLYPLPQSQLTALAAVPSLQAAVDLLGLAHRHLSAGLTGFEVMGQFALRLVVKHFPQQRVPFYESAPYCVVLENSDTESDSHARSQLERLLEEALEKGCVTDAVVAESMAQARALWHIRESIPLAQAQEGLNIKHDISIAVSRIPEFVAQADAALEQAFPGVVVYALVDAYSGSISAEHGIGSLKREKLEKHKSPVALGLMRSIKTALDPHNLFNPGRMLAARDH